MTWRTSRRTFDLGGHGLLMGILNVTPDSFTDGGRFYDTHAAVDHGVRMANEGAAIIDVGGESTRPGADPVAPEDELRRVIPVIEALRSRTDAAISIDTSKAVVARAAIEAGAEIINDVTALAGDLAMAALAAETGAGIVLMHMRGNPRTMQQNTSYPDIISDIAGHLAERVQAAITAGIAEDRIAIDPGIGFAKTAEQNWALIEGLAAFAVMGHPVVLGVSRKSFLKSLAGDDIRRRDEESARLTARCFALGARIFRVHEIPENLAALRAAEA